MPSWRGQTSVCNLKGENLDRCTHAWIVTLRYVSALGVERLSVEEVGCDSEWIVANSNFEDRPSCDYPSRKIAVTNDICFGVQGQGSSYSNSEGGQYGCGAAAMGWCGKSTSALKIVREPWLIHMQSLIGNMRHDSTRSESSYFGDCEDHGHYRDCRALTSCVEGVSAGWRSQLTRKNEVAQHKVR